MNEIKIQIQDYKIIEERLKSLGGEFYSVKKIVDTYFQTDNPNDVLKIASYDGKNFFLEELEKNKEGGFKVVLEQRIDSSIEVDKIRKRLELENGIKSILKSERHYFKFPEFQVIINLIDGVGEFLILTGENISVDIIENVLKIEDPKFIEVPFCEL